MKIPTLLLVATTAVYSVEHDLQLGPNDYSGSVQLLSQQVEGGAVRSDTLTTQLEADARFENVGLHFDAWIAMDRSQASSLSFLNVSECTVRLDYLFEEDEYFQIIPYIEQVTFVESSAESATWVGLDAWYLLPLEGVEVGCSIEYDFNDEYSWNASIAARELYQNNPLDLVFWQAINFGGEGYHKYAGGDPTNSGITTLELGVDVTIPLPWESFWATASIEGHWWIEKSDREARGKEVSEVMFSIGALWRLE